MRGYQDRYRCHVSYLLNGKCRGEWDLLAAFGHKSKSGFRLFLPVASNKAMSKVLLPESISHELDK